MTISPLSVIRLTALLSCVVSAQEVRRRYATAALTDTTESEGPLMTHHALERGSRLLGKTSKSEKASSSDKASLDRKKESKQFSKRLTKKGKSKNSTNMDLVSFSSSSKSKESDKTTPPKSKTTKDSKSSTEKSTKSETKTASESKTDKSTKSESEKGSKSVPKRSKRSKKVPKRTKRSKKMKAVFEPPMNLPLPGSEDEIVDGDESLSPIPPTRASLSPAATVTTPPTSSPEVTSSPTTLPATLPPSPAPTTAQPSLRPQAKATESPTASPILSTGPSPETMSPAPPPTPSPTEETPAPTISPVLVTDPPTLSPVFPEPFPTTSPMEATISPTESSGLETSPPTVPPTFPTPFPMTSPVGAGTRAPQFFISRSPTPEPATPTPPTTPAPGSPTATILLECPVEPMLYASSGSGDFFSMFQFCGGSFEAKLADTLVEIVVDPETNRAFAQQGRPVFEFFEFDLLTGVEIPNTRFSTQPVNQFHALEYGGGGGDEDENNPNRLYGGGWQHLGGSQWNASILYEIDPDSKSWTEVGPTGVRPLSGLAWTGTTMYGVSGAGAPPSELYELNLQTGQGTIVCEDLTAAFGSLVYYQPEGLLYGGTSDGNVAQIVPETCEVLNIDTVFAWSAGFRPVTGLTMGCPDP